MRISLSVLLMSASLTTSCFIGFADAGTPLTVLVDRSQLMMLSADPGTIVVGNPSMADVSVNGRQLFINGHSAGETNLMVFNQSGEVIGDYDVTIMQVGENSLTVFKGTSNNTQRYSYVCAPICERAFIAGDESAPFNQLVTDNQSKYGFSQGIKPGDKPATAPAAAQ